MSDELPACIGFGPYPFPFYRLSLLLLLRTTRIRAFSQNPVGMFLPIRIVFPLYFYWRTCGFRPWELESPRKAMLWRGSPPQTPPFVFKLFSSPPRPLSRTGKPFPVMDRQTKAFFSPIFFPAPWSIFFLPYENNSSFCAMSLFIEL